ncbi:hypothetical protein TGAM01_v208408 [Trichoderma gamsii]|uniref:Uncharacterized protein n=1 Tax=Trichoderma gamsii TaxID=398673 RepID=A0A2P4ZEK0_9HYPO|nr:hypothetical protein TGAM01_v208408 [Trichoderma gamsii]PON22722.1 hypothetical protein TGAM01_v208408 [Trichoderma gamsii]
MARLSDREEKQLILHPELLHKILMDYLEKDDDILNFILASKVYYEQFYDTLLLHNALRGGCTALEGAVKTANKAMMKKILEIPIIETAAPRNIWPRMVDSARAHKDLVNLLLQVDCVQASINEEAREIKIKERETWKERKFNDSWLQVMWNAIKSDQVDVVELFLSLGLTVESCDQDGSTALHIAAKGREKESLVQHLLEKYGADPNKLAVKLRPVGHSPLRRAAKKGNTKVVKLLLEYGADPCCGQPGSFCQALAAAVAKDHKDIVDVLSRDERIELNAHDAGGIPILSRAVMNEKTDIVQMLLGNKRIDPNVTTVNGKSPLMIAAEGVGFRAEVSGLAITKLLLSDKRVDMFLKDNNGWNALFHAANSGQHEVLEMYLKDGRLDPNEADVNLNTPVSCTRINKCLKLLINDPRVDLNKANNEGMTPLMQNVSWEWKGNVEQLLNSGRVDVNQTNHQGNTAMMMAISKPDPMSDMEVLACCGIVRCILRSGRVKLDLVNANGETALMLAVKKGMENAAKMILATGHCLIDIKDANGVTMIEYAIQKDSKGIVDMLLKTGEAQVTREIIESAQSEDIRDMLVRYKDMMEKRAESSTLA